MTKGAQTADPLLPLPWPALLRCYGQEKYETCKPTTNGNLCSILAVRPTEDHGWQGGPATNKSTDGCLTQSAASARTGTLSKQKWLTLQNKTHHRTGKHHKNASCHLTGKVWSTGRANVDIMGKDDSARMPHWTGSGPRGSTAWSGY